MAKVVFYEIHAQIGGNWEREETHDGKEEAKIAARKVLKKTGTTAVKVIEEIYDEETDKGSTRIVFSRKEGEMGGKDDDKDDKGEGFWGKKAAAPEPQTPEEIAENQANERREKGKKATDAVFSGLIRLFLVIGGIVLAIFAALYFYIG
jgi:hypothetical protein